MKKVLSILVSCMLLIGLIGMVNFVSADDVEANETTFDLISSISNGSNEADTTLITDNGSGFVISQTAAWNVWVLNYSDGTADFAAAAGSNLYLRYDLTVSGTGGHLCLNGWNNSVAAAIAAQAGVATTPAEDGTPMLTGGTYAGTIKITADMVGENGRLGIVGSGATVRKFQLVTGDDVAETSSEPGTTPVNPGSDVTIESSFDLITAIGNGSNDADTTLITNSGSGFVISQTNPWNVWVLYYNAGAADFAAAAGNDLYLVYDLTVNGTGGHLCLNGWNNSVAAAIAAKQGAATTPAEDGTPMLTGGTYAGTIKITADMIGEDGRLGIVGSGATIRKFQLATGEEVDVPSNPGDTSQPENPSNPGNPVVGSSFDLITAIGNGSNDADTTLITNSGSGFVISQTNPWNVWVLYYNAGAADFAAAAGNDLYLVYDLTVNGTGGHLCLNGWNNSVAAAIAAAAGAATTPAEDGTPMLTGGTYTGMIKITPDTIGEDGRFGIVGSGATIRTFQLATATTPDPSTSDEPSDEPDDVVKGDVDGDNEVSMKDVLAMRKFIAGLDAEIDEAAADVNGDDSVDMKDVLLVRKFIAGLIESL